MHIFGILLFFFLSHCLCQVSLVKDINPGAASSIKYNYGSYPKMNDFVNGGGRLFFSCDSGSTGQELCHSDGTQAGTGVIKDVNPSGDAFKEINEDKRIVYNENEGFVFFKAWVGSRDSLWKSDGCSQNTNMVSLINPSYSPKIRTLSYSDEIPDRVFFFASGSLLQDDELWFSDGSAAGTARAVDACPGSCPGAFKSDSIGFYNQKVYFSAASTAPSGFDQPQQLWRYDPVSNSGSQFAAINPTAPDGAGISAFATTDAGLFFVANDGTAQLNHVFALTSDAGPPVSLGLDYVTPPLVPGPNANVFFQADDGTSGSELCKASPTAASLVFNLVPGNVNGYAEEIVDMGSYIMFVGDKELYRSDGVSSSVLVKNLGGPQSTQSYPRHLTRVGDMLYFSGQELDTGRELWQSDGTEAGTMIVEDLCPGACSSNPAHLTAVNGVLFFSADLPETGRELYRLSGSQAVSPALVCTPAPAPVATPLAPSVSGLPPTVATAPTPVLPPTAGGIAPSASSSSSACSSVLLSSCNAICSNSVLSCVCSGDSITSVDCAQSPPTSFPPVTSVLPDGTGVTLSSDGSVTIGGVPATSTTTSPDGATVTATDATGRTVIITPADGTVVDQGLPPSNACTTAQLSQCAASCTGSTVEFCDCSTGTARHFCAAPSAPAPSPPSSSGSGASVSACTVDSVALCASGCGSQSQVQTCLCDNDSGLVQTLSCKMGGGEQIQSAASPVSVFSLLVALFTLINVVY